MCGLAGWLTSKDKKLSSYQVSMRSKALTGLLIAMQERGTEATGVGTYNPSNDLHLSYYKVSEDAEKFVARKEVKKILNKESLQGVIGHTRNSTHGANTSLNAHPFIFGKILGAHNGIISNYRMAYADAEVDSQAAFYLLDKYDNDYVKAISELDGSMALTWFNADEPGVIYLYRHTNPLHIGWVEDYQTMFWASTRWPLESILQSTVGLENAEVISIQENFVYRFDGKDYSKQQASTKKYEVQKYHNWRDDDDDDIRTPYLVGDWGAYKMRDSFPVREKGYYNVLENGKWVKKPLEEEEESKKKWDMVDIMNIVECVEHDSCTMCGETINAHQERFYYSMEEYYIICGHCGDCLKDDSFTEIAPTEYWEILGDCAEMEAKIDEDNKRFTEKERKELEQEIIENVDKAINKAVEVNGVGHS